MARRAIGPDTAGHMRKPTRAVSFKRAQAHPVFATINRLRETYLSLGFDEAENPVIIDEKDIYRQFGPEAMAVLDRVFYLGGLPRPNVGIARKQLDEINEILMSHRSPLAHGDPVPVEQAHLHEHYQSMTTETEEHLRETLHAYKKSEIDGDELTFELSKVLGVDDALVVHILDVVFPGVPGTRPGILALHSPQSHDERLVHDTRCHLGKKPRFLSGSSRLTAVSGASRPKDRPGS